LILVYREGMAAGSIGADGLPRGGPCYDLKGDVIRMNEHRALGCCSSVIFSEKRCALFRIMR
jgi:hypothetical protein